nr:reverse transcriptase domain-containing protein [Tanacetum cinerariifolium]
MIRRVCVGGSRKSWVVVGRQDKRGEWVAGHGKKSGVNSVRILGLKVCVFRHIPPVIIAKDLSDEEKTALITVLKSRKRAIAWKLSDIKGTEPEFYTHKILMEDDFEPAVQHQRRVNLKIHDVIKQEVLKILDAGLIYPISDSPWVRIRESVYGAAAGEQYPCCEDCGVTHEPYQCQPKNHDYYNEKNSCCDSNSFGFDHCQPPRYTVNHHIFNVHNDILTSQTTIVEQMTQLTSMCEMFCQFVQKKREEMRIEEEQAAKAQTWKLPVCYDDDDDEERSNSLEDNIISGLCSCVAITPNEPVDSLSMGDEHLNTVSAMESDEFIKSSVENLVPNPSESEGKSECNVPAGFTTSRMFFSMLITNSTLIDPHPFNAESDLIESMLNHDSSIIISSKTDSLCDDFAGELTLLKSILSGIDETNCHPEEETYFTKRLLYDNSSPRPLEEFVFENSNADIESFSPSPILIEDSDSFIEEIDLTFTPDDPMQPDIKDDDYDSKRDIPFLKELLDNYSLSLLENESYHFDIPLSSRPLIKPPDEIDLSFTPDYPMSPGIEDDDYDYERDILILKDLPSNDTISIPEIESFYFDIPSFSRPPAKPLDGNTTILNIKMMGDISNQKVLMHKLMITLVSHQEKSPDLLSHRGLKTFQPSAKCPMMIHGKDIPILDVPLFYFYPLDQLKYGGIWSSSST